MIEGAAEPPNAQAPPRFSRCASEGDWTAQAGRDTSDEWRTYDKRADRMRAAVRDPFRRRIERETAKGRALAAGACTLLIGALIAAFGLGAR